MTTVAEAERLIGRYPLCCGSEWTPLTDVHGRILAEDIVADRDQPPFHRIAMDGVALVHSEWEGGRREFPVTGVQAAGAAPTVLDDPGSCMEVMTGGVLPAGADCVVPIEDVDLADGVATIGEGLSLKPMQNVHERGADSRAGDVLVRARSRMLATHVAIAASVGLADVAVVRPPRVALIATGDELVGVDEDVAPHQIRGSNGHAMRAGLKLAGCREITMIHLRDDRDAMTARIAELLTQYDALILSGGVSMGKFDHLPAIMADLGVERVFHKIRQRPGRPFWFGVSAEARPVYALPGNPVSCLVCLYRYVLPHIRRCLGVGGEPETVVLAEEVRFAKALTRFLPVAIQAAAEGGRRAEPRPTHGSGDFAGLARSDGFVELDAETDLFPPGTAVPFFSWSP